MFKRYKFILLKDYVEFNYNYIKILFAKSENQYKMTFQCNMHRDSCCINMNIEVLLYCYVMRLIITISANTQNSTKR